MTQNGPLDPLIPSISKAFGPGKINLLERLRQFPEYEQTRDERSSEIDRWKGFKEFAVATGHLRKRGYDIMAIIVGEGDPDSRSELEDRFRIAEEMKSLNWSRLVESLAGIYDRLLRKALSNGAIRAAAK